ncbi:MAG: hypothetical protein IT258_02515, partial [Saprospiraceae bacterium]|nr:hypothetical protein [Saprospiraceae bacterium]
MESDEKILDIEDAGRSYLEDLNTKLVSTEKPIRYSGYLLVFIAFCQTVLVFLGKQLEDFEFKALDSFSDLRFYDFQFPLLYLV